MTGTKATFLDECCATRGLGYTRFDYSGHGASSGRFEDGTIGRWAEDAIAIIDRATEGPLILVGSSMGGWIMLLVALARKENVAGAIAAGWDAVLYESVSQLNDELRRRGSEPHLVP